jgi:hypothetical protein
VTITFVTLAIANAVERGQLLVVRLRPEPDRAGAHEPGLVAEADQVCDRPGEDDAEHEAERRRRHREPERRAHDGAFLGRLLRVEVEAEEGARDPHLQGDREHRGGRRHDLDLTERARLQVARVERQQDRREDPRDEAADAVDRRVAREAPHLEAEAQRDYNVR